MSYMCKTCLAYTKDQGCDGWEALGWKADNQCGECTDSDVQLLMDSPFAARLHKRIEDLLDERDGLIELMNKRAFVAEHGHCERCDELTRQLKWSARDLADAREQVRLAYDRWAELALGSAR